MRAISLPMAAHLQGECLTLAVLVTLSRRDGIHLGFTTFSEPLLLNGIAYEPAAGLDSSTLKQSTGTGVDNLDLYGLLSSDQIRAEDLRAGLYDGAALSLSIVNWADLTMGNLALVRGTIGEVTITEGQFVAELRSLSQALAQQIGDLTSATCRVRALGDGQCKVNLAPYTNARGVLATGVDAGGSAAAAILRINCGGGANGGWSADGEYQGGNAFTNAQAVFTGGVQEPAPEAVYQAERNGNFSYLLTGLAPGGSYRLRLHFAEDKWSAAGQRVMNVVMNHQDILTNFDIFDQAGGMNLALVEETQASADASGLIRLDFTGLTDRAKCCGIEMLTEAANPIRQGLAFAGDDSPSGYYSYGLATFTSGLNAGVQRGIRSHLFDAALNAAVITLWEPLPMAAQPGDGALLQAGCDRTWATCQTKFANSINFRGEPFIPGNSQILKQGRS